MRLDQCSWQEVDAYLKERSALLVPVGSTEQHGPMGLIGTDAFFNRPRTIGCIYEF